MTKQYQNNKNRKNNKRTTTEIRNQQKHQKRAFSAPAEILVDFV
jgi:hypothetical protein